LFGEPGVEIARGTRFAEKVSLDELCEYHLVGAKDVERASHLPCFQKTLDMHDVLEQGELAFIDEQHQFAGFLEISLRSQQAETGKPVVMVAIHSRRRDRQMVPPKQYPTACSFLPGTILPITSMAVMTPLLR
jgi:hypothetical protein